MWFILDKSFRRNYMKILREYVKIAKLKWADIWYIEDHPVEISLRLLLPETRCPVYFEISDCSVYVYTKLRWGLVYNEHFLTDLMKLECLLKDFLKFAIGADATDAAEIV